jgi:hypothetical protein
MIAIDLGAARRLIHDHLSSPHRRRDAALETLLFPDTGGRTTVLEFSTW